MINKVKAYMTKQSLNEIERNIFESLCENDISSIQKNKELAVEYAQSSAIKNHHIGELYKNDIFRDSFLTKDELNMLEEGMVIVNKFYDFQKEIEKEGFKILCSPSSMENILLKCSDMEKAKKAISILEKELRLLERDIAKKKTEKYQSVNSDGLPVSKLNDTQKESLNSLGFDMNNGRFITLSTLKKMYNRKLYSINSNRFGTSTDDYLKELSQAFNNVREAFELYS